MTHVIVVCLLVCFSHWTRDFWGQGLCLLHLCVPEPGTLPPQGNIPWGWTPEKRLCLDLLRAVRSSVSYLTSSVSLSEKPGRIILLILRVFCEHQNEITQHCGWCTVREIPALYLTNKLINTCFEIAYYVLSAVQWAEDTTVNKTNTNLCFH